jgi:hypothetical protein
VHCVPCWRRGQWWNDLEVYLVVDGVDTCKVGYLSKEFCGEADYLDNKYIRVDDVFTENDEDVDRHRKFYHSYGYALGIILSNQSCD